MHTHTHTHTPKPYQSLQKSGTPETQPGAKKPADHQNHSAGDSEDNWQDDVGARKK